MTRSARAWIGFAAAAGGLLVALGFVTAETLDRERGEARARSGAIREERIRQALWRMDGALSAVLAVEAARPPDHYGGIVGRVPSMAAPPEIAPSPILESRFPPFRLYFQIGPGGEVSSPQVPGPMVGLPDPLPPGVPAAIAEGGTALAAFVEAGLAGALPPVPGRAAAAPEPEDAEYRQRASRNMAVQSQALESNTAFGWPPTWTGGEVGPLLPSWIPGPAGGPPELVLSRIAVNRRGMGPHGAFRQGIWADWRAMKAWLLGEVEDLFPGADLAAVAGGRADGARMLAAIPARFDPGPAEPVVLPLVTPTRGTLALAWLAMLAALGGSGLLLRSALALGERRGRFASAVTHELRSPLTTFRMYSQMLHDGMAPPGAEKEYLATMEREAERLSRVVESVLLYARLEEGAAEARRERVGAAALLDRILPVLERRAAEAGLVLRAVRDLPPDAALATDPQAVEQILFNLVDNACKYAAEGETVAMDARMEGGRLAVTVSDRGPGIPAKERARVFEDFRRLDRDAAGSVPGAGLGLAVARALARSLGGDLVLLPDGPGAAFRLTLPASGQRLISPRR